MRFYSFYLKNDTLPLTRYFLHYSRQLPGIYAHKTIIYYYFTNRNKWSNYDNTHSSVSEMSIITWLSLWNSRAIHARVRGSFPGLGGFKETEMFLPHPLVLWGASVGCSASDLQGLNFESCVWRAVPSHSSHHPQEVLLAQFSLYVHKSGLKPDSYIFVFLLVIFIFCDTVQPVISLAVLVSPLTLSESRSLHYSFSCLLSDSSILFIDNICPHYLYQCNVTMLVHCCLLIAGDHIVIRVHSNVDPSLGDVVYSGPTLSREMKRFPGPVERYSRKLRPFLI